MTPLTLPINPAASGPAWTLSAAGDFSIGPAPRAGAEFAPAAQEFLKADLSIVNVEGVVRGGGAPIAKSGPWVEMDPRGPDLLAKLGVHCATLANNHIGDFGAKGVSATIAACRAAGLSVCGAGEDDSAAAAPITLERAGVSLAVFAFCEHEFGIAAPRTPGAAWISSPAALAAVARASKEHNLVIVAAHGGIERTDFSPIQRRDQLRRFIDAGAGLVIGHHPHVPQGWETYNGGLILHSLGNFLFTSPTLHVDQTREWGVIARLDMAGRSVRALHLLPVQGVSSPDGTRLILPADADDRMRRLKALAQTLADERAALDAWQALAARLWNSKYRRELAAASNIGPFEQAKNLLRDLKRGKGDPLWQQSGLSGARKRELDLLNLLRNESHRWAIETALTAGHAPA